MMSYSVLIVEDQEPVATRLAQAILNHPRLDLFGVASTLAQGQAMLSHGQPDVLLVDIGLPDGDGTQLIRDLYTRKCSTEAMIITIFGDEAHVLSALAAGATGYLLKDEPLDRIGELIMCLITGGSPISPAIARYLLKRFTLINNLTTPKLSVDVHLTDKEKEILRHISKGFSNVEIAQLLNTSHHTVMTHIKHIYRKLAVHSRTEALYEAAQLGVMG